MADYRGDDTTGFQSPAQDYIEPAIDLAGLLDLRRPGLYVARFEGQELRARGIHDGDYLVTNAAADPASGKVCIALLHGEFTLATLIRDGDGWFIKRPKGDPVPVADDVEVWGIVKALVRTKV